LAFAVAIPYSLWLEDIDLLGGGTRPGIIDIDLPGSRISIQLPPASDGLIIRADFVLESSPMRESDLD